ncbi:MAG TPA: response regulator transcription factor [Actinomycetota bacterium]|nr:response regulator transcription factor [Actinomycetota bacterium]
MPGRILIVDDDEGIRDVVGFALENAGFEVEAVEDGETALEAATANPYDAVVLDVMMPGVSGIDVCRELRARSGVPILMLTAKDAEVERVLGLELGADDYVTKPFSTAELVSRIRAVVRRRELDRSENRSAIREVGGLRIDFDRHEVVADGRPVSLTLSEFRLLALLAESPDRVYTRRQIMQHLWRSDFVGDEHACDVHVSNLRRKIERSPARPERLLTVRGLGYKLASA